MDGAGLEKTTKVGTQVHVVGTYSETFRHRERLICGVYERLVQIKDEQLSLSRDVHEVTERIGSSRQGAAARGSRLRPFLAHPLHLLHFSHPSHRPPTTNQAHAQLNPCFPIGIVRIRFPVAAKIALVIAGMIGGSAGSPSPVGALSVFRKCTSMSFGA